MNVLPGQYVVMHVKHPGVDRPAPCAALVQQVHRGTIVVAEKESSNGLAHIVIHGHSGETGTFWYEFTRAIRCWNDDEEGTCNFKYTGGSMDIVRLEDEKGNQICCERFIED